MLRGTKDHSHSGIPVIQLCGALLGDLTMGNCLVGGSVSSVKRLSQLGDTFLSDSDLPKTVPYHCDDLTC
jgi:hypothetical protein